MGRELDGCCSKFYKVSLIIFNLLIFLVGLLVFIFAAVLKWDKDLLNIKELDEIVKLTEIGNITVFSMIIGAFAILVSLIGLLGLWCLDKCVLIVYEIIIILLFLSHGIALLVLVFGKNGVEKSFESSMEKIIDDLNNNSTDYSKSCEIMHGLSKIFECCGNNGPSDFNSTLIGENCCENSNITIGCTGKIISMVTDNSINYLIIPSGLILAVELLVIIVTPFIISHISKL